MKQRSAADDKGGIYLTLRLVFHVLAPHMLVMLLSLGVLAQQVSRPQRHDETHLCPAYTIP